MEEIPLNPLPAPNPRLQIADRAEYNEWLRLLEDANRNEKSATELIIDLLLYLGENILLIITVSYDIFMGDVKSKFIFGAISAGLYVLTCLVAAIVNYYNQPPQSRAFWKHLLLNFFFLAKPIRFIGHYRTRRRRNTIIQLESSNAYTSRRAIESLAILNELLLQENSADMLEAFIVHVPIALIQTHVLLTSPFKFTTDWTRLGTIIMSLVHAARAVSTFEETILNYKQTLHFLDLCRTNGNNPMLIYSKDSFTIRGVVSFSVHFSRILIPFYTISHCCLVYPVMALIYISVDFSFTLLVLWAFPQHFLEIFQNPPHGVSNLPSYLSDRYINIFANVGNRFNQMTCEPILLINCRAPLVFIQFSSWIFSTVSVCLTINDKLPWFPILLLIFLQLILASVNAYADLFRRMDEHRTFSETFPIVTAQAYYQPLLKQVLQTPADRQLEEIRKLMVVTTLKSDEFYDVITRRYVCRDLSLFTKEFQKYIDTVTSRILKIINDKKRVGERNTGSRDLNRNQLLDDISTGNLVGNGRNIADDEGMNSSQNHDESRISTENQNLNGSGNSDEELSVEQVVDKEIRDCFKEGHRFSDQFTRIFDLINSSDTSNEIKLQDKLLFCGYFAFFDRKMSEMSSDRVKKIFEIMGMKVVKGSDGMRERDVISNELAGDWRFWAFINDWIQHSLPVRLINLANVML